MGQKEETVRATGFLSASGWTQSVGTIGVVLTYLAFAALVLFTAWPGKVEWLLGGTVLFLMAAAGLADNAGTTGG
jgi:hypothetical protein